MADDTEVPAVNGPKSEAIPNEDIKEADIKHEIRVNETELPMLEDETMPTYLSITTSNASSLKPDDSKIQPDIPEANTDDDDVKSIYDVSSGDEKQDNTRACYDDDIHDHIDDEDDEEEYYDESDVDSNINERPKKIKYRDETDDDIENEDEDGLEDEEDMESDDIEPELFERSSDDYILKSSTSNSENISKERSRSLQDLSSPEKLSRSNNRRHVFIHPEHYDIQSRNFNYNNSKQSSLSHSRYSHVLSKVKHYIQDIKEQNKRSIQRKLTDKVNNVNQGDINRETDNSKPNPQFKRLKSYDEQTMKNMIEDLSCSESNNINSEITAQVNGNEIISFDIINDKHTREVQERMEIDESNTQYSRCNKQINKSNGTINYSTNKAQLKSQQKDSEATTQLDPFTNKHNTAAPILNIESMSYGEYMKGKIDNNKQNDIINKNIMKCINVNDVTINPVNLSSITSAQTQNITAELPIPNKINNNIVSDSKLQSEKFNIHQNIAKNVEKEDDYQKIMNENLQLKREIEELKKALAIHQEQIKCKKVKIVAVQTDDRPRVMKHTSTTTHLQLPTKLSTSTMPDVGSTLSSIEHWTDSDYSPVVSLKPPNVEHLLNPDGSACLKESSPRNPPQIPSRALWTTNRILQTLANLTPGRPIPSMMEKTIDVQGQSKDPISPMIIGEQNSRKRKASDNLGASAQGPLPSKIPLIITTDAHRKFNSASDTDAAIALAGLSHEAVAGTATTFTAPIIAAGVAASTSAASQCNDAQNDEKYQGNEETDDDGIKCFVWHDNEDTEERSCLIQAPVDLDSSSKVGMMKKPVRECGPYLLGNLEVRISEANGTLNIWGKEVNQKLILNESENIDEKQNESFNDSKHVWPKTPCATVDNHFKCSTMKKSKTPMSTRASISRHLRGMLNRTPSPQNTPVENHSDYNSHLCQRDTNNCNQCHSTKPAFSTACKLYSCRDEREQIIDNDHCHCDIGHHRYPPTNYNCHCNNHKQNCICINHLTSEDKCKQTGCHRLSTSEHKYYCRHVPKRRCHSAERNNCNNQTDNICCQETNINRMEVNACGNRCQSEEMNSSMNFEKSDEIPEINTKRNRHYGKRVRNVMDFLEGCSECRNSDTASIDSCQIPETETTNTRSIPSVRIHSASPSMTQYPKYLNNLENQKGCNSCVKHAGRAAKLEAELEVIKVEISKLHSRSNAMRDMLHRVLQTDSNTSI